MKPGKYFYLIAVLSLLAANRSNAQLPTDFDENRVPGQRESLLSKQLMDGTENQSVDLFHGRLNISVPIFKSEDGLVNLSLNYCASGIKVAQEASSVGLGWNLNYGGSITREVRGYADDIEGPVNTVKSAGWLTDLSNSARHSVYVENFNRNNPSVQVNTPVFTQKFFSTSGSSYCPDFEPDIFSYQFNGHSGQFFFDKNGVPKTIPYANLDIQYHIASKNRLGNTSGIDEFTITDENGIKYKFQPALNDVALTGVNNMTAEENGYNTGSAGPATHRYPTKWFITEITQLNGEKISYTYVDESSKTVGTASYTVRNPLPSFVFIGSNPTIGLLGPHLGFFSHSTTHYEKRLTKISAKNFEVDFSYNQPRLDLGDGSSTAQSSRALTDIEIYSLERNSSGILASKKIAHRKFIYSYYQPIANYPADRLGVTDVFSNYSGAVTDYDSRLKLDQVQTINPVTSGVESEFSFGYNGTSLPPKGSNEQDLWGYYNNNASNTLIPQVWVYPSEPTNNRFRTFPIPNYSGTSFYFSGANRDVNANVIDTGILNKITLPTGGTLSYEYEPNDFLVDGINRKGEGLRIKKVTSYDGIDHANDIVRKYGYNNESATTGVLFNNQVWAYTINSTKYNNALNQHDINSGGVNGYGVYVDCKSLSASSQDYYALFMIRSSQPNMASSSLSGESFGYSSVKEETVGKGYVLHKYSTPGLYNQSNDQNTSQNSSGSCDPALQGVCNNLYAVSTPDYMLDAGGSYSQARPVNLKGYDFAPNFLPFAPNLNYDWCRGLEYRNEVYDNTDNLVKKVATDYQVFCKGNTMSDKYVFGLRVFWALDNYFWEESYPGPTAPGTPQGNYFTRYAFPIFSKYAIIGDVCMKPFQVRETDYLHGLEHTVNTEFTYSNSLVPHVSKMKTWLSNSNIKEVFSSYSSDYNVSAFAGSNADYTGLNNLQLKHVLNAPVESYTVITDQSNTPKVTAGTYLCYNDNEPTLKSQYRLDIQAPVSNFLPTAIGSSATVRHSAYSLNQAVLYNNLYQPVSVTDRAGVPSSLIYGYSSSVPIANVQNAAPNQIAYTSFEEECSAINNNTNWAISNNASCRSAGSKAKTGNYCLNYTSGTGIQTANALPTGRYILSFWADNASFTPTAANTGNLSFSSNVVSPPDPNGMRYYEYSVTINNPTKLMLNGNNLSASLDELRLYPFNASMQTQTYDRLVGKTSDCNQANIITRYEYDALNRPVLVRDGNGNIKMKKEYGIQVAE